MIREWIMPFIITKDMYDKLAIVFYFGPICDRSFGFLETVIFHR